MAAQNRRISLVRPPVVAPVGEHDDLNAVVAQFAARGRLLTPGEAAEMLGLKVRTLERWRSTGEGPAFLGISRTTIRYTERAVAEFVAGCTMKNTANRSPQCSNGRRTRSGDTA